VRQKQQYVRITNKGKHIVNNLVPQKKKKKKKTTLCNLCFLSSFSVKTVLASLARVSLLMLLDCTPVGSFRLGWTSVTVLKKSIPRTAHRSCTVLTNSKTFCNLSLCQTKQCKKTVDALLSK